MKPKQTHDANRMSNLTTKPHNQRKLSVITMRSNWTVRFHNATLLMRWMKMTNSKTSSKNVSQTILVGPQHSKFGVVFRCHVGEHLKTFTWCSNVVNTPRLQQNLHWVEKNTFPAAAVTGSRISFQCHPSNVPGCHSNNTHRCTRHNVNLLRTACSS